MLAVEQLQEIRAQLAAGDVLRDVVRESPRLARREDLAAARNEMRDARPLVLAARSFHQERGDFEGERPSQLGPGDEVIDGAGGLHGEIEMRLAFAKNGEHQLAEMVGKRLRHVLGGDYAAIVESVEESDFGRQSLLHVGELGLGEHPLLDERGAQRFHAAGPVGNDPDAAFGEAQAASASLPDDLQDTLLPAEAERLEDVAQGNLRCFPAKRQCQPPVYGKAAPA